MNSILQLFTPWRKPSRDHRTSVDVFPWLENQPPLMFQGRDGGRVSESQGRPVENPTIEKWKPSSQPYEGPRPLLTEDTGTFVFLFHFLSSQPSLDRFDPTQMTRLRQHEFEIVDSLSKPPEHFCVYLHGMGNPKTKSSIPHSKHFDIKVVQGSSTTSTTRPLV